MLIVCITADGDYLAVRRAHGKLKPLSFGCFSGLEETD